MNNDRRKFRVWNELYKCYDYSFSLDADGHLWGHCSQENATFEQCTGLRDRNGELIYEYYWEETKVDSADEYNEKLNSVYDLSKSVEPTEFYHYDTIYEEIYSY